MLYGASGEGARLQGGCRVVPYGTWPELDRFFISDLRKIPRLWGMELLW